MHAIESAAVNLEFRGRDVHRVLKENRDVVSAIWGAVSAAIDTAIVVWIEPQVSTTDPLEWHMTITSPLGRRTCIVSRRTPNSTILFSDQ